MSKENPVLLGPGPSAERMYLSHLRDEQDRPLSYRRIGSVGAGPDGHVLDLYELTSADGDTLKVYIDMYHEDRDPLHQPPPSGLRLAARDAD